MLDFDISPVGTSRLGEVDFDSLVFGKVFSDPVRHGLRGRGVATRRNFCVWTHDVLSCHDVLALRPGHL